MPEPIPLPANLMPEQARAHMHINRALSSHLPPDAAWKATSDILIHLHANKMEVRTLPYQPPTPHPGAHVTRHHPPPPTRHPRLPPGLHIYPPPQHRRERHRQNRSPGLPGPGGIPPLDTGLRQRAGHPSKHPL